MDNIKFLEKLSNIDSISGHEHNVSNLIKDSIAGYVDEIKEDSLGNIIAIKKGSKPDINIMLAAHMDEIGLMVTKIEENGFLRVTEVGGIDPRTILGQEVIVLGRENLFGVVGSKPPHLQDPSEINKAIDLKDLVVDIGLSYENVIEKVRVGDVITLKREFTQLKNDRVVGKCLDNKAGVVGLYATMKELKNVKHEANICYVFTVQEEISLAGAMVSSYSINPTIGIAVDVGFGKTPELKKQESLELGDGPGVTLGGNIHPNLRKFLIKNLKEDSIKHQTEIDPGPTGTDGRAIQITREGIPTLVLSIPLRYMHTSVEVIDMKDIKYTGKALASFIKNIDSERLEEILCY